MYIDSHCHLNFPELKENLPDILQKMQANQVKMALCINVDLAEFEEVLAIAQAHEQLYCSVGVHPEEAKACEPTVEQLVSLAQHPKVVGIGECGLDYYWPQDSYDYQTKRFATHIQASKQTQLPLIVHTRSAREATIDVLQAEQAESGVLHCFTEDEEMAKKGLDMGFYISFSGIITFKSATALQEVVKYVPLDRMLIETDSPFLSPVPYRGKTNDPSKVIYVAEKIAELKGLSVQEVARQTTANFFQLFSKVIPI
ncbi:TatD family hydrolase [Basilea psittacipulmonis]|uniref:DNAase n=1 Tax=Basilea psittacipulmonis DSM 24701 TaxID=1072685 RepID=A0A077DEQ8_9BURK|nr:TatD family hydrolase [Basilea psittacipulmonis]AIL32646.1 DNAase [Basilea psittacipulmonis DSM 24701]